MKRTNPKRLLVLGIVITLICVALSTIYLVNLDYIIGYKSDLMRISNILLVSLVSSLPAILILRIYTKDEERIKEFSKILNFLVSGSWSVNKETGLIDVNGNVSIYSVYFTHQTKLNSLFNRYCKEKGDFPFSFGVVNGDIMISGNLVRTLKSLPKVVTGECVIHSYCDVFDWKPESVGFLNIDMSIMGEEYKLEAILNISDLVENGNIKIVAGDYVNEKQRYYERKLMELI